MRSRQTQSTNTAGAKRSRSVTPIPQTIERIKGYPDKLIIFKVPASPYWWVRYHDSRPIKRSTKTDVKHEAIRFAKKFYESVLVNNVLGRSNNPKITTFIACASALIQEDLEKAKRNELSKKYASSQRNLINKHIKTFFGAYELTDIDYPLLDQFKTYLFEQELVTTTVKAHFVAMRKIFTYGIRHGFIKYQPSLPDVKNEDNPRGHFSVSEYVRFRRAARAFVGRSGKIISKDVQNGEIKEKNLRNIVVTEEFSLMIGFWVYSFLRPSDIKQMKHKHIEIRSGDEGEYLWMPLPKSKKHDSPITSMPRAAYFYRRLKKLAIDAKTAEIGKRATDREIAEDFVFSPMYEKREYAYQQLYRQFKYIQETIGLIKNSKGDVLAPYSLRHTSIMYRLIYGGEINTTKIAKNARTTTEMIERFYVAQLESSDVTKDLHKRKKPREKRDSKIFIKVDDGRDLNEMMNKIAEQTPEHIRKKKIRIVD